MKVQTTVALLSLALAIAGCSRVRETPSPQLESARTELSDVNGRRVGDATLQQVTDGVLIIADLAAIPSGTHAMHLHTTGSCTPTFEAAGGHFNPTGARHGYRNPEGPHAGDLPNIHLQANGTLRVEVYARGLRLTGDGGLLDDDGAALVIHQFADDYATDPSGAAGDRIACGVIRR
jgi:superoxide dismutase, Cu-Zn family